MEPNNLYRNGVITKNYGLLSDDNKYIISGLFNGTSFIPDKKNIYLEKNTLVMRSETNNILHINGIVSKFSYLLKMVYNYRPTYYPKYFALVKNHFRSIYGLIFCIPVHIVITSCIFADCFGYIDLGNDTRFIVTIYYLIQLTIKY